MKKLTALSCIIPSLLIVASSAFAITGNPYTYTEDADFDAGSLLNVNHDAPDNDQLQLEAQAEPFNFIWVAVSSEGTVVKIDTLTGAVLGEYRTAPQGMGLNPSRTTVDLDGSVWTGNRYESGWVDQDAIAPGMPAARQQMGSAVHIGLEENGQCVDRNGNSVIDTSSGLGDVEDWDSGLSGVDSLGGVTTAEDECIIHYTRVTSTGTRHISVDANNDVWVGGTGANVRNFDLVDGDTGSIIRHEPSVGYGGYGGLIDGNGVIWSARNLLRWDTADQLSDGTWTSYSHDSYGLCIDTLGNVWNTALFGNMIRKFAPDGTLLGTYSHGSDTAQGCVVDGNDHVWVAHSILGPKSTVGHLLDDGTYIGNVAVGSGPTGMAVDGAGKIWATNYYSQTLSRIDPALGPLGADGITPVGDVDFTSGSLGGNLYNYSDMTGSTLIAPPDNGTWEVVHDSGMPNAPWSMISWTSSDPGDSSISVTAASSDDNVAFSAPAVAINGAAPAVPTGRYMKIIASFARDTGGASPILYDLTLLANQIPDCTAAYPDVSSIWPPNHKFVDVGIFGVTDPDGDPVTISIWQIYQDEPTDADGDGQFAPDASGVGTDTAQVRAERSGLGDGRVYTISFTAADSYGAECTGEVKVGVPHDKHDIPVDGGPLYDSTL